MKLKIDSKIINNFNYKTFLKNMSTIIIKHPDKTISGVVYGVNKKGKIVSSTNIILLDGKSQLPIKRYDILSKNCLVLEYPICNSCGTIIGKTFMILAFLYLGLRRYTENCTIRTGFFGIALNNFEVIHHDFQEILIKMIDFSWGSDCLEKFLQWFDFKYKNRLALIDTISTILSDKWKDITRIDFNSI
jgi:hypothetical protein